MAGACCVLAGCQSPSRIARPPRDDPPNPIIFATGFESETWLERWRLFHPPRHAVRVAGRDAFGFRPLIGAALRVTIPAGEHAGLSELSLWLGPLLGAEPDEIYFRYSLRLSEDFSPVLAGKLPGLAGTYGRAGWGGRQSDGTNGWSARGMFLPIGPRGQDGIAIGSYCYHAQMDSTVGDAWIWPLARDQPLHRNRWYCIEQYVKLNTPGENDGIIRGWIDGQPAFEKSGIRFRDVPELRIERVWFDVYHGGKLPAAHDYHLYFDEIVISREPIGPVRSFTGHVAP